jgi:hypothetical protein
MRWVKQYSKKKSAAHHVISRMRRRDDMAKKKSGRNEHKEAKLERVLAESIPPEKYFVLHSGICIRNIEELAHMLDTMSDADYSYHVNDAKNDFANWIRDVFNKPELADAIIPIKDRKESQIVLLKHVLKHK